MARYSAITDALVLKPQAISTHSADKIFHVLNQFHREIFFFIAKKHEKIKLHFEKDNPVV